MEEILILRMSGRGNGFLVRGCKSKREREYIIDKIFRASLAYRKLYKLRKCCI